MFQLVTAARGLFKLRITFKMRSENPTFCTPFDRRELLRALSNGSWLSWSKELERSYSPFRLLSSGIYGRSDCTFIVTDDYSVQNIYIDWFWKEKRLDHPNYVLLWSNNKAPAGTADEGAARR